MRIASHIREKLELGEAVVAVESTLLTHGLSYPRSLQLVLDIEEAVRRHHAEPAVVAMLHGELCVGLDHSELEWLARAEGRVKLATADVGAARAKKQSGGTTAAVTAWMARQAGIRVALAGGLGGVHRDVWSTWDISGDLTAMAQNPVMMVCGGIKSFLDIGKSLEALETLGVPTWSYRNAYFPGYFVRDSKYRTLRVESAEEAAAMALSHWELGFSTGIVLGVSIPEEAAFDHEELEAIIAQAMANHNAASGGKGVTPYIIRTLEQYTAGRTAAANQALLLSAAETAAKLAAAYAKQR